MVVRCGHSVMVVRCGHSVMVVSAAPPARTNPLPPPNTSASPPEPSNAPIVVRMRQPRSAPSPPRGGSAMAEEAQQGVVEEEEPLQVEWALVVDWSAVPAFQAIAAAPVWAETVSAHDSAGGSVAVGSGESGRLSSPFAPPALTPQRVSTSHAASTAAPVLFCQPSAAPRAADLLSLHLLPQRPPYISPPPCTATVSAASWPSDRLYLVCCVRLSPEKNAALLPPLLRLLAPHLPALGVTPLLCAGTAATRGAFGQAVLQEVVAAAPGTVVVDGFMGPERMAQVYSQTLLNIHPCLYDAYGMTVVEAAALAAPSVIHVGPGGAVGAAELLPPQEQLALPVDLSAALPAVAESILALLRDRQHLAQVGLAARRRSLEWSEEASARSLTAMLQRASV
ncbi:unnamed protein product [Closterium sp. Yama58-4]|nr:unnamed protein product [Closterium sp. Yama58-4]